MSRLQWLIASLDSNEAFQLLQHLLLFWKRLANSTLAKFNFYSQVSNFCLCLNMEWCESIWNSLRSIWTSTETDHRIPFPPFFFILQREENHDFYIYSKILKECKDIDQSDAILVFTKGRQWFPIYWSVIPSIFPGIWVPQKQHCGYQRSQNLDYDSRSFGEKKKLVLNKAVKTLGTFEKRDKYHELRGVWSVLWGMHPTAASIIKLMNFRGKLRTRVW